MQLMRWVLLPGIALASISTAQAAENAQAAIAKRLAEAILGERTFEDPDFAKPLGAAEKAVLMNLASCKYAGWSHTYERHPTKRDMLIESKDTLLLDWKCAGASPSNSPQLMITFDNGRVSKIQTFAFDQIKPH